MATKVVYVGEHREGVVVPEIGVFKPGELVELGDEKAKKLVETNINFKVARKEKEKSEK
ncbi:MAG: hypothetical protein ACE5OY_08990 [Candidatus Bathyarchaeia archaeon]